MVSLLLNGGGLNTAGALKPGALFSCKFIMAGVGRVERGYEEFVEKFQPKLTTDDCYTPDAVYAAVKEWAVREYGLEGREIVRPFWPGADYENCDYPGGCVVIDNPPFSILSKIKGFYKERGIDFFLFAPHLTLFSSGGETWGEIHCCRCHDHLRKWRKGKYKFRYKS